MNIKTLSYLTTLFCISYALPSITPKYTNPQWTTLASLPHPWQEHSTVALNTTQTIYIIGGVPYSPPNATTFPSTLVDVAAYSIEHNTWKMVAPLPIPLNHPNAATVNNKIYVLGGLQNGTAWLATNRCFEYDPPTDTWMELPPMPLEQARGSSAMGVHNGKIYLAGGMTELSVTAQTSVATVSVYDPASGNWTTLPSIPDPRDHVCGAVVGDKMYVVGGRHDGQFNWKNTTWALDLNVPEQGWDQTLATMPTARGGLAAGAIGSTIYTFGGEGDPNTTSQVFPQVEAYDTEKDVWTRLPDMPVPRHGTFAAAVDGGGVYIPGGGLSLGDNATVHFDVFKP